VIIPPGDNSRDRIARFRELISIYYNQFVASFHKCNSPCQNAVAWAKPIRSQAGSEGFSPAHDFTRPEPSQAGPCTSLVFIRCIAKAGYTMSFEGWSCHITGPGGGTIGTIPTNMNRLYELKHDLAAAAVVEHNHQTPGGSERMRM
jgi:hypothetical protein